MPCRVAPTIWLERRYVLKLLNSLDTPPVLCGLRHHVAGKPSIARPLRTAKDLDRLAPPGRHRLPQRPRHVRYASHLRHQLARRPSSGALRLARSHSCGRSAFFSSGQEVSAGCAPGETLSSNCPPNDRAPTDLILHFLWGVSTQNMAVSVILDQGCCPTTSPGTFERNDKAKKLVARNDCGLGAEQQERLGACRRAPSAA